MKLDLHTIYDYLVKGTELGLCNYSSAEYRAIVIGKRCVRVNTKEIFLTLSCAGKKYNVSPDNISVACKSDYKHSGRCPNTNEWLSWEYYSPEIHTEEAGFKLAIA